MLQEMARNGFVIVAVGHPYDANVVEFANGLLVGFTKSTPNVDMETSNIVRAQDVSTAINEMENLSVINTTHMTAFGYGFGGASAAGLNFDGNFFSSLLKSSTQITKPFLQFGSQRANPRPNWNQIWKNQLKGWKLEVEFKAAKHGTYEDIPLVLETLGVRGLVGQGTLDNYGTVGGKRALEILRTYVSELAKFVTEGNAVPGSLLNGGAQKYPEVTVARSDSGS